MNFHSGIFSGKHWCCFLMMICSFSSFVFAADAAQRDEARFRQLTAELRCLVCQNQSIADSSAALAVDLRAQISEQMAAGKSDEEIRAYMVSRYGDFILYSPPLKQTTLLLWIGPFVLLVLALGLGVFLLRRRAALESVAEDGDQPVTSRAEALWQRENKK